MNEIAFELQKKVGNVAVYVRGYKTGIIKCWAEPPTIDAEEYVAKILDKHNIPYTRHGNEIRMA